VTDGSGCLSCLLAGAVDTDAEIMSEHHAQVVVDNTDADA